MRSNPTSLRLPSLRVDAQKRQIVVRPGAEILCQFEVHDGYRWAEINLVTTGPTSIER